MLSDSTTHSIPIAGATRLLMGILLVIGSPLGYDTASRWHVTEVRSPVTAAEFVEIVHESTGTRGSSTSRALPRPRIANSNAVHMGPNDPLATPLGRIVPVPAEQPIPLFPWRTTRLLV